MPVLSYIAFIRQYLFVRLLLSLGLILWLRGKFRFGSVDTEGRHVKAAGVVLMLPALSTLLLGMILMSLFGAERGAEMAFSGVMVLFGLSIIGLAITIAYILIANPQNAPRLPGILGVIQDERRGKTAETTTPPPTPKLASRHPLDSGGRSSAPSQAKIRAILSVNEAATYMGVTPADILTWIDRGELPAARDNYRFQIARSVLDDLKQSRMMNKPLPSV
jgi:excisionase family DNA binding protein